MLTMHSSLYSCDDGYEYYDCDDGIHDVKYLMNFVPECYLDFDKYTDCAKNIFYRDYIGTGIDSLNKFEDTYKKVHDGTIVGSELCPKYPTYSYLYGEDFFRTQLNAYNEYYENKFSEYKEYSSANFSPKIKNLKEYEEVILAKNEANKIIDSFGLYVDTYNQNNLDKIDPNILKKYFPDIKGQTQTIELDKISDKLLGNDCDIYDYFGLKKYMEFYLDHNSKAFNRIISKLQIKAYKIHENLSSLDINIFKSKFILDIVRIMSYLPNIDLLQSKSTKITKIDYFGFLAAVEIWKLMVKASQENIDIIKNKDIFEKIGNFISCSRNKKEICSIIYGQLAEITGKTYTHKNADDLIDELKKEVQDKKITIAMGGCSDMSFYILPYNTNKENIDKIINNVDNIKEEIFKDLNESGFLAYLNTAIVDINLDANVYSGTSESYLLEVKTPATKLYKKIISTNNTFLRNIIGRKNVIMPVIIDDFYDSLTNNEYKITSKTKIIYKTLDLSRDFEIDKYGMPTNILEKNNYVQYIEKIFFDAMNKSLNECIDFVAEPNNNNILNKRNVIVVLNKNNCNSITIFTKQFFDEITGNYNAYYCHATRMSLKYFKDHFPSGDDYEETNKYCNAIRKLFEENTSLSKKFHTTYDSQEALLLTRNYPNKITIQQSNLSSLLRELNINDTSIQQYLFNSEYNILLKPFYDIDKITLCKNPHRKTLTINCPIDQCEDILFKMYRYSNNCMLKENIQFPTEYKKINEVCSANAINIIADKLYHDIKENIVYRVYIKDLHDKYNPVFFTLQNSIDTNFKILKPINYYITPTQYGNLSFSGDIKITTKQKAEILKGKAYYVLKTNLQTGYHAFEAKMDISEKYVLTDKITVDSISEGTTNPQNTLINRNACNVIVINDKTQEHIIVE